MKISFDSLNANQNVDRVTTSSMGETISTTKLSGAYALDISGTVMDNSSILDQGKIAEDVMQNAEQGFLDAKQNFMTVMSNFMSAGDYEELEKNGFKPGSVDAETIVTVVDEIKAKLAEAGIEIKGYNDDLSTEELARITGSEMRGRSIADKLKENDMPVNSGNVKYVNEALRKCEEINGLSDGAKKYLIQNKSELTIDNVYCAQFTSVSGTTRQGYGYYAEEMPGYYAKKAEGINWDSIEGQINTIIEEAGIPNDIQTQEEAKWLIMEGIPLTKDNVSRMHKINSISFPINTDSALNAIVNALWKNKGTNEAVLTDTESICVEAERIRNTVDSISEDTLRTAVTEAVPLTIKNLKMLQDQGGEASYNRQEEAAYENDEAFVTARRQLEEIRLQMTFEANLRLLKSGYSIDTTELSELVDKLKAIEQTQKEVLYQTENPELLKERDQIYQETLTKTAQIPSLPAHVIGKVAGNSVFFNLNYVYLQGTVLKSNYEQVQAAYETVMTVPRADLGDSIQKAFRNVDDILMNLDLAVNDVNERAVRILGYNNMPVNEANIALIKDADLTLNRVIRKLTPGTTLQLIRDGINPLSMNLEELDEYLNHMETPAADAEKYSRYLYQLERNHEITPEEKEAYIGIYRLIRQVEKSDGAVIGSLVNQGAELSFKNLLSAVRTAKSKAMDYYVDDDFGGVEGSFRNKSISSQIESYYTRLTKEIYDTLSPEKIANINFNDSMTLEEFAQAMQDQGVEEDADVLRQYRKEILDETRNVRYINEKTLSNLLQFDQEITTDNLMAADYLLQYRGSAFRQLFGRAGEQGTAVRDRLEQAMYKLQRNLTDEETALRAYDTLCDEVEEVLDESLEKASSHIDVRSISNFHKQISLARNLAKKENYEVPVLINGQINSINLQIMSDEQDAGKVKITFSSDVYGKVYASFQAKEIAYPEEATVVSGMIASSDDEGIELLKKAEKVIRQELTTDKCIVEDLFFTVSKSVDINTVDTLSGQGQHISDDSEDKKIATKTLYDIAKAFIIAIQSQKGE